MSGYPPPSFWVGSALAVGLSCALKFVAIVLQQEVIGRRLGQYVSVRAAVGINSPLIRAARFVLQQPGLSFDKCLILCGGPDCTRRPMRSTRCRVVGSACRAAHAALMDPSRAMLACR